MNQKRSFVTSTVITLLIVVMLIISGPAQAVLVSISGLQTAPYTKGTAVNFTVSINISDPDRFVPITNLSINVTGAASFNATFALDGTLISGDFINTTLVSAPPMGSDFGYGYGYGCDNLTCFNFGYGYGYGYGYGAGNGKIIYTYNVSINTTSLPFGSYAVVARLNTGRANKPAFTSAPATFEVTATVIVPLPVDPATNRTIATVNATSPSGNVTITIPKGTQALVNGTPVAYISINSTTSLPSNASVALSANNRVVGEVVELAPPGATFEPPIQMRFNYTEPLPSGVSEDSLQVSFFNVSTNSWETLTDIVARNQSLNYIIANVSHFSTFALLGTVSAASIGGAVSGGGTGGGGGVVTSEPYDNIAKAERRDADLIASKPVTYSFVSPELAIYELLIIGKENENDVAVRVESLKGTSKLVKTPAHGKVYVNENVWAGSKRIQEITVKFRVKNSWIEEKKVERQDIQLLRWDNVWKLQETKEVKKDDTYTYYEAKTTGLSSFAISVIKLEERPKVEAPTVTATATPTETAPAAVPTEKVSGFEFALAIAAMSALYVLRKR